MSGDGICINLSFVCFYFTLLFSEQKEQFLQVTRLVKLMSLPVQTASVLRVGGCVIWTMTVVITPMKPNAVSCIYFSLI